jgi:Ca-activated chloride channel homolog
VTEWFRNGGGGIAEGHYLYPLPGEASFSSFSLFQGDEELRGEALDAAEARRIYEDIVRRVRDPALIELAGQGLLRARVFPFQPGETRKVILRYEQLLAGSGGGLRFSYQGGSPALARPSVPVPMPRPLPETVPVPRGGRIALPDGPTGIPFELVVENGRDFLDPFSPTHRVTVERTGNRVRVRTGETVTGALTLLLPHVRERVGMTLATHRLSGEDGWVMLALSPGRVEPSEAEPRDVTVVLDVSGSMSGTKMEQARGALHQLLGTLDARDRFRLVVYSTAIRSFRPEWTPARGAALDEARRWVDALRAEGGTNISGALEEAFRVRPGEGRLPMVIFLTDGLPTAGERDPERIAAMAEASRGRARVFAFGVGYDVNTRLLDALAAAGRGTTAYVQPDEDVEVALGELASKIRHPVLTDLALVEAPVRIHELYPVTIPDLFAGEELVLLARYEAGRRDVTGDLVLTGTRAGRTERFQVQATFPAEAVGDAWLPRLWASRKLGHLSRQVRLEGETGSLVEEIRTLALRYGLVSEYTSYLVVEPGMVADAGPGRPGRPGERAVALDQLVVAAAPAATAVSGAGAVRSAEADRARREARSSVELFEAEAKAQAAADEVVGGSGFRRVAGRSFRQAEGVWRDLGIRPEARVVRVAPFSRAWFQLVEALPELREAAGAFEAVALGGRNVTLEFVPGGEENLSAAQLRSVVADFR